MVRQELPGQPLSTRSDRLRRSWDGAVAALQAVIFDARDDHHLSWTPMIVERVGGISPRP